ncbi:MAG: hypothetical protein EU547_04180 [Promethearchaeota archaeon]|nr:MAG: hypothetical protein EU547_04180 [Candidatus Lokiarchaeota archaeon]
MTQNLTLLKNIRASEAEDLEEIGIFTIEQLAESSPKDLEKDLGIDINIAEKWIVKAIQYLEDNEKPKVPPNEELTSKYSMKTTTTRDIEQNRED